MLALLAQVIILIASLVVLTVCAAISLLLVARMWRDFRPRNRKACGTVWAVLIFGTISVLCGIGAYTVAAASVAAIFGAQWA